MHMILQNSEYNENCVIDNCLSTPFFPARHHQDWFLWERDRGGCRLLWQQGHMSLPDSHPAHPLLFMGAGGSHPRIPRLPGDGVGASRTQLRRQVRRWLPVSSISMANFCRSILQILIKPFDLHELWKSGFALAYLDKADSSISRVRRLRFISQRTAFNSLLGREWTWHGMTWQICMIFSPKEYFRVTLTCHV